MEVVVVLSLIGWHNLHLHLGLPNSIMLTLKAFERMPKSFLGPRYWRLPPDKISKIPFSCMGGDQEDGATQLGDQVRYRWKMGEIQMIYRQKANVGCKNREFRGPPPPPLVQANIVRIALTFGLTVATLAATLGRICLFVTLTN